MFTGFSAQTMDFLWGIRLNNNKEWFDAHKQDYQEQLYAPMKELAQEVFAHFRDVPNMAYKCSRIYKDARLHPAVPYKESLWLSMRPEDLPWSEQPTLYFEITPEGCSYGFILWKPKADAMERFRSLLDGHPDEFLNLVKKTEKASGLKLTCECYARRKPSENKKLAPYYHAKTMMFCKDVVPGEEMFTPKLKDQIVKTLKALYPFYEYCLKFTT